MCSSSISVIVPVYNEADIIDDLARHLASLDADEIIVVDGGSTDGTDKRLREFELEAASGERAIRVYQAEPGRARQMNTGALHATGDILLFLHADTRLPQGALKRVVEALHHGPNRHWGRFDVRFDHAGPLLRLVAWFMNRRSAATSICTGDQALFVRRSEFLRIGGFAPLALMEDIELSRRLKRRSLPLRVRGPAITSSRRWLEHGVARTIVLMWRLRWLYWWGVPASRLSRRYYPDH